MIEYHRGNILYTTASAVVNPVNCVGVAGAGLAKQIANKWPVATDQYRNACKKGLVKTGKMLVVPNTQVPGPEYIINFPTKRDWRHPSEYQYIQDGLQDLSLVITTMKLESVAIPPLGCGLGGLMWDRVEPLIIATLKDLEEVKIIIYPPK